MDKQVALIFSDEPDGRIPAVDLHTGATLTTYRGSSSTPGSATLLGPSHFVCAQRDRRAVHTWAWHKDAVVLRSFTSEQPTALAASPCGTFLAAGGGSGFLHLWEASTGQLVRCARPPPARPHWRPRDARPLATTPLPPSPRPLPAGSGRRTTRP